MNPATLGNAISLGIQPVGSVFEYNDQFPDYLKSQTQGIKAIGKWGQPSFESIILLKPDVMIGWRNNYESIYSQLSNIAPTVLSDFAGNAQQASWKEYFKFIAEILDREEIGKQILEHYNQRIEELKMVLGDRFRDKTISFVVFAAGGIYSEATDDPRSFISSVLKDAGLQRPKSQRSNPEGSIIISEETLEMIDADVMFVIAYGGNDTGERDLSILQKKPLWQTLKAVQNNRVYYVDLTIWRGHTPLAADAVIDDLYKYLVNTP